MYHRHICLRPSFSQEIQESERHWSNLPICQQRQSPSRRNAYESIRRPSSIGKCHAKAARQERQTGIYPRKQTDRKTTCYQELCRLYSQGILPLVRIAEWWHHLCLYSIWVRQEPEGNRYRQVSRIELQDYAYFHQFEYHWNLVHYRPSFPRNSTSQRRCARRFGAPCYPQWRQCSGSNRHYSGERSPRTSSCDMGQETRCFWLSVCHQPKRRHHRTRIRSANHLFQWSQVAGNVGKRCTLCSWWWCHHSEESKAPGKRSWQKHLRRSSTILGWWRLRPYRLCLCHPNQQKAIVPWRHPWFEECTFFHFRQWNLSRISFYSWL